MVGINQKNISKARGWKMEMCMVGKSLWNIHVRCFVPSHSLVQGEENILLVPSCPKVSPPPKFSWN